MSNGQFLVHALAICIAVGASFTFMVFLLPWFRSTFETRQPLSLIHI